MNFEETVKTLRQEVYNKLQTEYLEYRSFLLKSRPDTIIDKSFETSEKKSILDLFKPDNKFFNLRRLQVVLKKSNALEFLYQSWLNDNGTSIDDLKYSVERRLDIEYHYLSEHKTRIFFDMDGTLAEFKKASKIEELFEKGYFANLKPLNNIVETVKLLNQSPDFDVYILSSVLKDSKYARAEKTNWLKEHLPELNEDQIIYSECGSNKTNFVPGGINPTDILLDDYTVNLLDWQKAGGRPIKVINGINDTLHVWQQDKIVYADESLKIAYQITDIAKQENITFNQPSILPNEIGGSSFSQTI